MDPMRTPERPPTPEPYETGKRLIWTLKRGEVTSGLSQAHRYLALDKTYCSLKIPPAERMVPTDLLVVPICERCERLHAARTTIAGAFSDLLSSARGAA